MSRVSLGIRSFRAAATKPASKPTASRTTIQTAQGIVRQTLAAGHTVNHPQAQGAVRTLETNGSKVK